MSIAKVNGININYQVEARGESLVMVAFSKMGVPAKVIKRSIERIET